MKPSVSHFSGSELSDVSHGKDTITRLTWASGGEKVSEATMKLAGSFCLWRPPCVPGAVSGWHPLPHSCAAGEMVHILQMKVRGREITAQGHTRAEAELAPVPLTLQPLLLPLPWMALRVPGVGGAGKD